LRHGSIHGECKNKNDVEDNAEGEEGTEDEENRVAEERNSLLLSNL
jgi:hypothetical protein